LKTGRLVVEKYSPSNQYQSCKRIRRIDLMILFSAKAVLKVIYPIPLLESGPVHEI